MELRVAISTLKLHHISFFPAVKETHRPAHFYHFIPPIILLYFQILKSIPVSLHPSLCFPVLLLVAFGATFITPSLTEALISDDDDDEESGEKSSPRNFISLLPDG